MRILKNSNKTVFVATGLGKDACPRMITTSAAAKFKDDYKGRLTASKKLTKKLFMS